MPLGVLAGDVGRIYAIRPHDEDLQCGMGIALIQPSHTGGLLWFTLTRQLLRPDEQDMLANVNFVSAIATRSGRIDREEPSILLPRNVSVFSKTAALSTLLIRIKIRGR